MINGLIGKKLGTGQFFKEDGSLVCVTAVQGGPCTVTQVKTKESDGYGAVQLGFGEAKRLSKPLQGHLKPSEGLFRHLREFRAPDTSSLQVGQVMDVSLFQPGDRIDVVGTSKGKGFAGGVKRHHFAGGPKTHGQSDRLRAPGSIGSTTFPGRVLKGLRMAGHMGNARVTVENLRVAAVYPEKHALLVEGALPGYNGSLLLLRLVKRPKSAAAVSPAVPAGKKS